MSENKELKKKWDPFVEISMEKQEQLLGQLDPQRTPRTAEEILQEIVESDSPADRFSRIDREIRLNLRRQIGSPLLDQLEQRIVSYVQSSPSEALTLTLEDGFQRMLLHGICQYFCLSSKSVDTAAGRSTVVSIPSHLQTVQSKIPKTLLSQYLVQLFQQPSPSTHRHQHVPNFSGIGMKKKKKRSAAHHKQPHQYHYKFHQRTQNM